MITSRRVNCSEERDTTYHKHSIAIVGDIASTLKTTHLDINNIWRNMESTIRLFADDCVIYRKIINNTDMEKLQKDLDRLGEWAVENAMKINPSKSTAIRFTRARVKDPLNYSLMGTLIPEASSCKYLGIILSSDLSWEDQVNYTVKKAWTALHFTMGILKRVIVIPKV